MRRNEILTRLKGGDRRSIGQADRVAKMVRADGRLFEKLMEGLWSEDALVRIRAADAAEKVTREKPEWLARHRKELLGLLSETEEQEMRWHLAVMVPRLELNAREKQTTIAALNRYLEDRSSIVKTFALQGLADLATRDASLRPMVVETLRTAMRNGTPAMRARSRKLLKPLEER